MNIAFADFSSWDYHALSVEEKPMGGTQSAVCYLTRALAEMGHEVRLIGAVSAAGSHGGVASIPKQLATVSYLQALKLDALICILAAGRGAAMRHAIGPEARLILWTGHDADQPDVLPLLNPSEPQAYDGFALVSNWQRERFLSAFNLDPSRVTVLRNAIAPAFENLFPGDAPILDAKLEPPVLAYTSTPFRGLELLLDAFPAICASAPDARLQIFSSMNVYQLSSVDDRKRYGALYERCRQTPGVKYVGSLPQRELALRLREASVLVYPNTFPETSCISIMEAMASGCRIVTSNLGALPETTAGFGRLVPPPLDRVSYQSAFVDAVVRSLQEGEANTQIVEAALRRQVGQINTRDTWHIRAGQWTQWLNGLVPNSRRVRNPPSVKQLFDGALSSCRYGRLREAEPLCRQILAREPAHADALHLLGLIAAQTDRLDEAIVFFQQTVAAAPSFADAYNNLGNALKHRGRVEEATTAFRQATAIKAKIPTATTSIEPKQP